MSNKKRNQKSFLCSFCGVFRTNLERHEKLHEEVSRKIKCAAKNCEITFQHKWKYYEHWDKKHQNLPVPNELIFKNMERKDNKFYKDSNLQNKNISTIENCDNLIVENFVESNAMKMNFIINQCLIREPMFGQMI